MPFASGCIISCAGDVIQLQKGVVWFSLSLRERDLKI